MKAYVLHPDGLTVVEAPELAGPEAKVFTYIARVLGTKDHPATVEPVFAKWGVMYCDEDGIAKGLPPNRPATALYRELGGQSSVLGRVVLRVKKGYVYDHSRRAVVRG